MTRRHRSWHFWIWLILVPLTGVALALAWYREPLP